MFIGIVIVSLIFFCFMGMKRLATFLYLVKLALFVGQAGEAPKSHSAFSLFRDFFKYRMAGLRKNPQNILQVIFSLPAYTFIGMFSPFTDKYFVLDQATTEEVGKLLTTMSADLDLPPFMDQKTALKIHVVFTTLVTVAYKSEFSNAILNDLRELAIFMKEKNIEVSQLTEPEYLKDLSKNLRAHFKS
jgi:hypothetical protein